MTNNQEQSIKFHIDALDYSSAFIGIINDERYAYLKQELESISQIILAKWLEPSLLTIDDTFPMYLTGFKPSDIAKIRGVTRQSESLKVSTEIEKLLLEGVITDTFEVEQDHLNNRALIEEIVVQYYVSECGLQKDITLMDKILGSKYRTNRSKYVAYLKLGGDKSVFRVDDVDNRYVSTEDSEELKNVYDLFDKGHTNREVADELGLQVAKVYYYRRKHFKVNNPNEVL